MTTAASQDVIDELDQLLERERAALLAGDLDTIARILDLKEALIDRINGFDATDHAPLGRLREKLGRNQALLVGAMEGIRAVADRMADLRRVRLGLETYDKSGRRHRHQPGIPGTVERRA